MCSHNLRHEELDDVRSRCSWSKDLEVSRQHVGSGEALARNILHRELVAQQPDAEPLYATMHEVEVGVVGFDKRAQIAQLHESVDGPQDSQRCLLDLAVPLSERDTKATARRSRHVAPAEWRHPGCTSWCL